MSWITCHLQDEPGITATKLAQHYFHFCGGDLLALKMSVPAESQDIVWLSYFAKVGLRWGCGWLGGVAGGPVDMQ